MVFLISILSTNVDYNSLDFSEHPRNCLDLQIFIFLFCFSNSVFQLVWDLNWFDFAVGGSHVKSPELFSTKRNSALFGPKLAAVQRKSNLVTRRNLISPVRAEHRYAIHSLQLEIQEMNSNSTYFMYTYFLFGLTQLELIYCHIFCDSLGELRKSAYVIVHKLFL